jgi:hypothetical protein
MNETPTESGNFVRNTIYSYQHRAYQSTTLPARSKAHHRSRRYPRSFRVSTTCGSSVVFPAITLRIESDPIRRGLWTLTIRIATLQKKYFHKENHMRMLFVLTCTRSVFFFTACPNDPNSDLQNSGMSDQIMNVTVHENSTRTLSGTSSSLIPETFQVDKKSADTCLLIQGTISGYTTTGLQIPTFRYFTQNSETCNAPFDVYNPNSTDDPRLAQTKSTYTVWEILP